MKAILSSLISFAVVIIIIYIFPYISNFTLWLIKIDNTDFGIPIWLNLTIDIIAGLIAFTLTGIIFNIIGTHDKYSMSKTNAIISIIVGFIIGVIVHIFMKYWYIIISIIIISIICIILFFTLKRNKNKLKGSDEYESI